MIKDNINKPIILFGAGNFGKLAADYYGAENIYCYVDNNEKKEGQIFCGKEIISFKRYKEIYKDYYTVIATNAFSEISKQLNENNITEYGFYSPRYAKYFDSMCEEISDGGIALLGIDDYTEQVLKHIERIKEQHDIRIVAKAESDLINTYYFGYLVEDIECLKNEKNINLVIATGENNAAMQVYAERIVGENVNIVNPFMQVMYYDTDEIIYSNYSEEYTEYTEDEWIASMEYNPSKKELNAYVDELNISKPLFEHVEIETINRCNGTCDFCPVSAGNDIRKKHVMDEKLFYKIVDQLAELNYSGRFATFSNNEPFLDKRIIEFNKYAREKLPKARIHMFTNGTLLTLDKFIEIVKYLDELIIDNYEQDLKLIPNAQIIKEYCEEHKELKKKVTIVMRKPHEILTSRGGDAPNRTHNASYPDIKCALPFKQLIIRPDGKVSLCCNDPYGKCTLGDLNYESVLEVWNGKAFDNIRKKLSQGRGNFEHCKYCDTFIIF